MHLAVYIIACCCCLGSSLAQRYHEKTRFDRSINREIENVTKDYILQYKNPMVLYDLKSHVRAYKLEKEGFCYLENVKHNSRELVTAVYLTDIEAWNIAGERVMNFCRGMSIILMQETRPVPDDVDNPFYNELPEDEDNIFHKSTVIDKLRPIKIRAKRRIFKSMHEKLNEDRFGSLARRKRETSPLLGRFRGQTQSQYLNVGTEGQKEGKAEAEATQQSSRAVVSGSSGMGQAQSMSSAFDGCEGCLGYNKIENVPGSIQGILGSQQGQPTGGTSGLYPTRINSGSITTETRPGTVTYPSDTQSGIIPDTIRAPQIPVGSYPSGFGSRIQTTGIGADIQRGILPNTEIIREDVIGSQPSRGATPSIQGVEVYPQGISSGSTRGSAGTYLGTIPGTIIPGGSYPSAIRPATTQGTKVIGRTPEKHLLGGVSSPRDTQTSRDKQYISETSNPTNQRTGNQVGGTDIITQIPGARVYSPGTPVVESRSTQTGTQTPGENVYPPVTQIVGDRNPSIQIPVENVYSSGTGRMPGIQIPEENSYSPGTQIMESYVPGTQISGGIVNPSGTQIVRGQTPDMQIHRGVMYPPGTEIVGGRRGIQIPGVNLYSPNIQIMRGRAPGTQIPAGNTYISGRQIVESLTPENRLVGENIYPPGAQIVEDCVPGTQIPGGNMYSLGTQTRGENIYSPGTQIPRENMYFQGTHTPGGNIYSLGTQIPERNVYPPGTQILEGTIPRTQTPGQLTYPPATPAIEDGTIGIQTPRENVAYSLIPPIVRGRVPGVQIPEGNFYSPQLQRLADSVSEAQISGGKNYPPSIQVIGSSHTNTRSQGETAYPPNTQVVAGSNIDSPIPGQITYLPNAQTAGSGTLGTQVPGESIYPVGTQITGSNTPRIQIPQGVIYSSNSQVVGSGMPGNQISGGTVYSPNKQVVEGMVPRTQLISGIVYPSGIQMIRGSSPSTQIPGQISYSPATQVVGSGSSGMGIPGRDLYPPDTQIVTGSSPGMQIPPSSTLETQIPTGRIYSPGILMIESGTPENPKQEGSLQSSGPRTSSGTYGDNKLTNTPGVQISGRTYIPIGTLGSQNSIGGIYPGGVISGDVSSPTITYIGNVPNIGGSSNTTTGKSLKPTTRGDIPGTVTYLGLQPNAPTQSGTSESVIPTIVAGGGYSPSSTGQARYPDINVNTGSSGQYPGVIQSQQYPGGGTISVPGLKGEVPASNVNVQEGSTGTIGTGVQRTVTNQSTNAVLGLNDSSDSQAMSSVKQDKSGTLASASAEGKHGHGSAKSQVSGIYNGNGSFSAQAGTSDDTKSAQTQVSGGKEGAKSSAQGSGGLGKSQTQVQLDSDSGATSTNAQSNGWNHGTNSQVQASAKGGMADAQANGEGQTSSQAQVGFQPYINRNEKLEKLEQPFRGSGTASAQSGTFRGQSQSQLQGSFHYGISYSGAAQAGSGSGSTALRKPFNFTNSDPNLFKIFKLDENEKKEKTTEAVSKEQLETSGTSLRQTVIAITPRNKHFEKKNKPEQSQTQSYDIGNTDDEYEEYEDVDYGDSEFMQPTSGSDQIRQRMRFFTNGYDVNVKHEEKTEKTNRLSLPGYIASVDKKKMTSTIGKKIIHENNTAQSKTIISSENRTTVSKPLSDTRSLHPNRVGGIYYGGLKNSEVQEESSSPKTNFVSVSNSIAGKIDDKNITKKYEHRYYTKSSTCGYFTFSCNVVYGSNGRRKICKPKMPTYSDGTPKC